MRANRVVVILGIVCSLLSSAAGAGADQRPTDSVREAEDARIERSRADLRAAQAAREVVATELDRAAAAYEQARAHADRLTGEARETERSVTEARAVAVKADTVLRQRLHMLFKHPELRATALSPAVLSGSVGESLHRVELIEQLTEHSAEDRGRANRALGRVRDAEHDYRVVRAGVREAVRDRRERAAELSAALSRTQHRVEAARENLEAVEAAVAAEREQRRRERERAARLLAQAGGVPLPPVDGKTCPIGAPNGFSDTWGAPRSGGRLHQGVDMFAAYGMPLYAVDDGSVRTTTSSLGGLSIHLVTDDGDRYYYAHLSDVLVTAGQRVRGGQKVGFNGNSGNARSTPPHLHWEYHPGGGAAVNPYPLALALCRS